MVSVSETHMYLFIIKFSCFDSSIRIHFLKYNDSSDTEFKLLGHLPPVFSQAYFIIIPLSFIHHIFPIFESSIFLPYALIACFSTSFLAFRLSVKVIIPRCCISYFYVSQFSGFSTQNNLFY